MTWTGAVDEETGLPIRRPTAVGTGRPRGRDTPARTSDLLGHRLFHPLRYRGPQWVESRLSIPQDSARTGSFPHLSERDFNSSKVHHDGKSRSLSGWDFCPKRRCWRGLASWPLEHTSSEAAIPGVHSAAFRSSFLRPSCPRGRRGCAAACALTSCRCACPTASGHFASSTPWS